MAKSAETTEQTAHDEDAERIAQLLSETGELVIDGQLVTASDAEVEQDPVAGDGEKQD